MYFLMLKGFAVYIADLYTAGKFVKYCLKKNTNSGILNLHNICINSIIACNW